MIREDLIAEHIDDLSSMLEDLAQA